MNEKLTKILATIGPTSESPEILENLFKSGVNACRLNFSHGSHEEHANRIANIRQVADSLNQPVAILMDLCGPKVRTDNQSYTIQKGEHWLLVPLTGNTEQKRIGIAHPTLHKIVPTGSPILFDDGKFAATVIEVQEEGLLCEFQDSGLLKPRKAVNTPGIDNELAVLSEKDQRDLRFGILQGVDWIAVSFVRNGDDMRQVRRYMEQNAWSAPLIAKIETPLAMDNLEDIIQESDGVMVARGDLGIECPIEDIPLHQHRILQLASKHGKLAIVATQMLESMIENPRPTRAEVTDISHAVTEGTHVVMLSGETASGKYPVEAVQVMQRTLHRTESGLDLLPKRREGINDSTEVLWAAVKLQARTNAQAIVVLCSSLDEVSRVASLHSRAPVITVCSDPVIMQRSALYYGIRPIMVPCTPYLRDSISCALVAMKEKQILMPGHRVVFVFEHNSALRIIDID